MKLVREFAACAALAMTFFTISSAVSAASILSQTGTRTQFESFGSSDNGSGYYSGTYRFSPFDTSLGTLIYAELSGISLSASGSAGASTKPGTSIFAGNKPSVDKASVSAAAQARVEIGDTIFEDFESDSNSCEVTFTLVVFRNECGVSADVSAALSGPLRFEDLTDFEAEFVNARLFVSSFAGSSKGGRSSAGQSILPREDKLVLSYFYEPTIISPTPVPVPASGILLAGALAFLGTRKRRRSRAGKA